MLRRLFRCFQCRHFYRQLPSFARSPARPAFNAGSRTTGSGYVGRSGASWPVGNSCPLFPVDSDSFGPRLERLLIFSSIHSRMVRLLSFAHPGRKGGAATGETCAPATRRNPSTALLTLVTHARPRIANQQSRRRTARIRLIGLPCVAPPIFSFDSLRMEPRTRHLHGRSSKHPNVSSKEQSTWQSR